MANSFRELAIKAGREIMSFHGEGKVSVDYKDDKSPVTQADIAADRLIRRGLSERWPDLLVVTEEEAGSHARTAGRFVIVDPLDGTSGFVRGSQNFTVNIAYVEGRAPVLGVVYAPAIPRLFYTAGEEGPVEETGALDPARPGPKKPLRVRAADNQALVAALSRSHRDSETDAYLGKYSVSREISAGSSLKFCLIAAGEADLYPRFGRTMEWDTAAGHAILEAAGGRVVEHPTHSPLAYGKPKYENPSFIACGGGVELKEAP